MTTFRMTKICEKCRRPMIVIKAQHGIPRQGHENVTDPVLLYKCPQCGDLIDAYKMGVEGLKGGR